MKVYQVTAEAEHDQYGPDASVHYLAAYSYEQASRHVRRQLEQAGWRVVGMYGATITVQDIRDSIDHTTDE